MSKRMSKATSKPRAPRHSVLDSAAVDRIISEVEAAVADGRGEIIYPRKGRPSLTGQHGASPSVGFRVTPELRARAEAVASKQGLSVSALARRALEDYIRKAS